MLPLSIENLAALAPSVAIPAYDRSRVRVGMRWRKALCVCEVPEAVPSRKTRPLKSPEEVPVAEQMLQLIKLRCRSRR